MTGATIAIDNASAADTILSVKQRVFAANRSLYVRRQRLVYSAGPRGMDALADDETLGGAGVARDGTAQLDVLLADSEYSKMCSWDLGRKVCHSSSVTREGDTLATWLICLFQCLYIRVSSALHLILLPRLCCELSSSWRTLPKKVARTI
jgi:hypothetical protein